MKASMEFVESWKVKAKALLDIQKGGENEKAEFKSEK